MPNRIQKMDQTTAVRTYSMYDLWMLVNLFLANSSETCFWSWKYSIVYTCSIPFNFSPNCVSSREIIDIIHAPNCYERDWFCIEPTRQKTYPLNQAMNSWDRGFSSAWLFKYLMKSFIRKWMPKRWSQMTFWCPKSSVFSMTLPASQWAHHHPLQKKPSAVDEISLFIWNVIFKLVNIISYLWNISI